MLSLAGIPPTAGFPGKFYVFSAAIDAGDVCRSWSPSWTASSRSTTISACWSRCTWPRERARSRRRRRGRTCRRRSSSPPALV